MPNGTPSFWWAAVHAGVVAVGGGVTLLVLAPVLRLTEVTSVVDTVTARLRR